ncbi:MAG: Peptidoglycan-binding lysin domain, partial [Variovorax sp.]|nr:Peptidoglycan-binding lysin domain [Variovorax sp.]
MGLLSFIKEAGEKLFGGSSAHASEAPAAGGTDVNAAAAAAVKTYIETQNLGLTGLQVTYAADTGVVTLAGSAPSQEASEKASLAAGNVANVTSVDNNLEAPAAAPAQYHDVV